MGLAECNKASLICFSVYAGYLADGFFLYARFFQDFGQSLFQRLPGGSPATAYPQRQNLRYQLQTGLRIQAQVNVAFLGLRQAYPLGG